MLNHSRKKRKDGLETPTVLFTFLLEIEIGVAVQEIHQNTKKQLLSIRNFLVKMTFEAILATFCCCELGYVCCYDLLKRHNQHLFLTIW